MSFVFSVDDLASGKDFAIGIVSKHDSRILAFQENRVFEYSQVR